MALLVFDASRPETLDSVGKVWLADMTEELDKMIEDDKMPIMGLVAAKTDLGLDADVEKRARAFALEHGMRFHKTSAKSGVGVTRAFEALAEDLVQKERQDSVMAERERAEGKTSAVRKGKKATKKLAVTSRTKLPGDEAPPQGCPC